MVLYTLEGLNPFKLLGLKNKKSEVILLIKMSGKVFLKLIPAFVLHNYKLREKGSEEDRL